MKRILLFLLPLLLYGKETHILMLHSYSNDYAWTQRQNDGFLGEIKTRLPGLVTIEAEYLGTKRLEPDTGFFHHYRDFLRYKYAAFHPDAIYVSDDNALDLIHFVKQTDFKSVPVFFSGINHLDMELSGSAYAGVFERKDIETNFRLIHRLFPGKKRLLIIGDNSQTYTLIKQQITDLCSNGTLGFTLLYAESENLEKILSRIQSEPDAAVLLTTVGKMKNEHRTTLPLEHIITAIAETASQPLFCMEDVYMHPRIIGGYVTSGTDHGKEAAKMMAAYLEGTPIDAISTSPLNINRYLFSDPALKRFGLRLPRAIEKEATLLFTPPTFFQENEKLIYYLIYALVFFIIAGMFAFILFILHKNRLIDQYGKTVKKSERRLREMFERHSAIMLLIDPATSRILDANPAAAAFYGYPVDRLKNMRITDINTQDPKEVKAHEDNALTRNNNYFVFKHRLANGEIRDVEVHSTPITVEQHKLLFSIIHDITEVVEYRTRLEAKVQSEIEKRLQHEQMLIQQSKLAAMGEMINAIAHQWRQPLNALGLLIQDLPDAYEYGELDLPYLEQMVEDSNEQINFMSGTIDDFRTFFRPDKHKTVFDVKPTIKEVVGILDAQLRAHDIACLIHGESYEMHNHRNEFKQVILNLLNNAKDAIMERGVPGRIDITLAREPEHDVILIKDTGGGIPETIIKRIFEPYFTTKDQGKGTGIGLYIVKTIVEEHMAGSIAASTVDKGAEFVLRFKKNSKEPL